MPTTETLLTLPAVGASDRRSRQKVVTSTQMSLERVQWHLDNWAEWMQGERVGSSYRRRAAGGLRGYGGADFDQLVDAADARCAEAVNTCIDDLQMLQHVAVHHVMLASVFRFRGVDAADLFLLAKLSLCRTIPAKGIA